MTIHVELTGIRYSILVTLRRILIARYKHTIIDGLMGVDVVVLVNWRW